MQDRLVGQSDGSSAKQSRSETPRLNNKTLTGSLCTLQFLLSFQTDMDPLSIVGTAVGLAVAIAKVTHEVERFTRQIRDARKEMGDIARELGSLKAALEMLTDELQTPGVVVPSSLEDILKECEDVIKRLDETLEKYNRTA